MTCPSAPCAGCPSCARVPRASRRALRCRPPGGIFPFAARPAPLRPGSLLRKPFSSSALGAQVRYSLQDPRPRTLQPPLPPAFCACAAPGYSRSARRALGGSCSALHFRRARVRQVCCDTLLPGCRPPWPPPCCPDPRPAFCCPPPRGPLRARPVRPALRALLTRGRPLGAPLRARSQFEAALVRSTARHARAPAVLRDISPGTSYQAVRLVFRRYAPLPGPICTSGPLRASAGVSPAVALAGRSSPPFGPLRARSAPLRPSAPAALRAPRVPLARAQRSLVRVSRRAARWPSPRALCALCFAPFHSAPARLFAFPSRYFSSIGLPRSLAFDGSLHPSPCAPMHSYSPARAAYGASTLSGPSAASLPACRCTLPPVRRGLLPFRSPLLRESVFVSSPPRTDMLKSRGCSRVSRPFRYGRARCCAPFRVRRALPRPDSQGVPRGGVIVNIVVCCTTLLVVIVSGSRWCGGRWCGHY